MRNENGFGGIVKLSGNRRRPYAVRVTVGWNDNGKQIFKYISYHAKKSEAQIALAEYNKNPYDLDNARITFEEVYSLMQKTEFNDLSESSLRNYRGAYNYSSTLHKKVFKELKKNHLQGVINSIKAPTMCNIAKLLFLKMYKFALENDIVTTNYAQYLKVPKKEDSKEKQPFGDNEIKYLWDNIDGVRHADIVLILLYTGLRIGELLDIKKENVFLKERYMIGGKKTNAGKNRIIPIHKRILPLVEYHFNRSTCPYLIMNNKGAKLQYVSFMKTYWSAFLSDTGVKHTPHDTRHTFISNMDRTNVNRIILKRIVGHSNKDVTENYTHKNIEELIEAVDKLE